MLIHIYIKYYIFFRLYYCNCLFDCRVLDKGRINIGGIGDRRVRVYLHASFSLYWIRTGRGGLKPLRRKNWSPV
jgi:hypothetical protein